MANIDELFSQANTAQQGVVSGMQAGTKLPDMLRQAVSERFKDSPIYAEREGAAQNLMNTPSEYRADMANLGQSGQAILSPSQQQALVSQARSAAVTPLMTLNDILSMRTGSVSDIMKETMGAYNTDLQAKQLNAQNLYQQAQDTHNRNITEREMALKEANAAGMTLEQLLAQYTNPSVNLFDTGEEFDFDSFGLGLDQVTQPQETVSAPTQNVFGNIWDWITGKKNNDWASQQAQLPKGGSW